jgi:beta-mannanase
MHFYWRHFWRLRWFLLAILVTILLLFNQLVPPAQAVLGVYDPAQMFRHSVVTIEHHFVPWRPDQAQELQNALQQIQKSQRSPMISLEPWPWNAGGMTRETLLQDIVAGKYDATIDRSLKTIQQVAPTPVLLRWGDEMEIVGQYPWSVAHGALYIAAYRHMVARSRLLKIDNIRWVWSPAGHENAANDWPGEDVVDIVGISIYATREWHPDGQDSLPSFERLMQEKYRRAQRWQKPVMVAEVGVNASPAAQKVWLTNAVRQLGKFPDVMAWVYFNQIQPEIVPLSIGQPDWSLKPEQAQYLAQTWPVHLHHLTENEKLVHQWLAGSVIGG